MTMYRTVQNSTREILDLILPSEKWFFSFPWFDADIGRFSLRQILHYPFHNMGDSWQLLASNQDNNVKTTSFKLHVLHPKWFEYFIDYQDHNNWDRALPLLVPLVTIFLIEGSSSEELVTLLFSSLYMQFIFSTSETWIDSIFHCFRYLLYRRKQ